MYITQRTPESLITEALELWKHNDPYAGYSDDSRVWRAQQERTDTIRANIYRLASMGCDDAAQELEDLTQIKRKLL